MRTIEGERTSALVDGNLAVVAPLLADDFELIDPTGQAQTKDEYLTAVRTGVLDYLAWTAESPMRVRVVGDAAVLRYTSSIDVTFQGTKIPGRFWQTEYYEQRDGHWLLVWGQTTPIQ